MNRVDSDRGRVDPTNPREYRAASTWEKAAQLQQMLRIH